MKLSHPGADIFVPDANVSVEAALARTTHLGIGAHQDDLEIMAYHGIAECFGRTDRWFSGVVVTDGAKSPRSGAYAAYTDEQIKDVRRAEQRKAAAMGEYSIQIQLGHSAESAKEPDNADVPADLRAIFSAARAEVVYLHQPGDKHDAHIAVLAHSLAALRALPVADRPKRVLGCEVWRDLDWMCDAEKQALDVSAHPKLAAALIAVFDSQVSGGKRYDLATVGRRLAHATYHEALATDRSPALTWAMDLTPLVQDPTLSVRDYTRACIDRFRQDVEERLGKYFS
ncbi:MAG TPA: PIG-L family deacetylase [Opitutaceae bacterium]|nr:PIG-L family deacetylase [Opitutaceae bacterium]